MKRKQFLTIFLAIMLSAPSLQASTQTFAEGTSVSKPPASNAMFDVNTSTSNVTGEIQAVADEVEKLLNNDKAEAPAAAPKEVKDHTVQPGDSLWKIAQQLLGDGNRYPEIVAANKDKYPSLLKNPDLIHAGWNLKVPIDKPADSGAQVASSDNAASGTGTTPQGSTYTGPVVTMGGTSGVSSGSVTQVPQLSVTARVAKLQGALDKANRALLAQKKKIADLNAETVRFLIDNKFMTEEEWMSMNPPDGYVYRLDRVGKVELVGADNKPLSNADMAKLDSKAPATPAAAAATDKPAPKKPEDKKPVVSAADKAMADADAKSKQQAHDKVTAAAKEKAAKDKAAKDKLAKEQADAKKSAEQKAIDAKAAADKSAAEKAAAQKIAAQKAAEEKAEKAAAEKAEKVAAEKAATKYQQIIKGMGMPDLSNKGGAYYNAMSKGAQVVNKGAFKSNSFAKFCDPMNYPQYDVARLQKDLSNAQANYEKTVDKNKTSRVLGIFGDTIESAGKKVEDSKKRLEKAWTELKKSMNEAEGIAKGLKTEVAANKTKIAAAKKDLSKLDAYDSANAKQVQKLNKDIKNLNESISDSQKKIDAYQVLNTTFKM